MRKKIFFFRKPEKYKEEIYIFAKNWLSTKIVLKNLLISIFFLCSKRMRIISCYRFFFGGCWKWWSFWENYFLYGKVKFIIFPSNYLRIYSKFHYSFITHLIKQEFIKIETFSKVLLRKIFQTKTNFPSKN